MNTHIFDAPQDGEYCELDFVATFRRGTTSDQKGRSVWTINTNDLDAYGSVIPPKNGDLSVYKKNPVVLINHRYDMLAGRSRVAKRGSGQDAILEAIMRDGDVTDGGDWDLSDDQIARYASKVEKGLMRGASIGFSARWKRVLKEGGDPDNWRDYYYLAEEWTLHEWSIVTVPANPNALKTGRMLRALGRDVPEQPTQIVVPGRSHEIANSITDIDFDAAPAETLEVKTWAKSRPLTSDQIGDAPLLAELSLDESDDSASSPDDEPDERPERDREDDAETTILVPTKLLIEAGRDAEALDRLAFMVHTYARRAKN